MPRENKPTDAEPFDTHIFFGKVILRIRAMFLDLLEIPAMCWRMVPSRRPLSFGLRSFFQGFGLAIFFPELRNHQLVSRIFLLTLFFVMVITPVVAFVHLSQRFEKTHVLANSELRCGNAASAMKCYKKLVAWRPSCDSEVYQGYIEAAAQVYSPNEFDRFLSQLAPDEGVGGVAIAHAEKAIRLSESVSNPNTRQLQRLKWHLDKSSSGSSLRLQLARGRFQLALGHLSEALPYFKNAAKQDPVQYLTVARIYQQQQRLSEWMQTLKIAEAALAHSLAKNRTDTKLRVAYAEVLFKLNRLKDAEETLLSGIEEPDSNGLRQSLSDLYVAKYQQSENSPFPDRLLSLKEALEFSGNNERAQVR